MGNVIDITWGISEIKGPRPQLKLTKMESLSIRLLDDNAHVQKMLMPLCNLPWAFSHIRNMTFISCVLSLFMFHTDESLGCSFHLFL